MSYRSVTAGVGLIASESAHGCEAGGVQASNGSCCDDKTWWNWVYAHIKGELSLRYHNEKRVRHALWLLSAAQLDEYAWKREAELGKTVRIDPKMTAGVARAAHNFNAIYPRSRWLKKTSAVGHDHHCGPFSVWTASTVDPNDPVYVKALAQAVSTLSPEFRTPGHFALKDPGKDVIYSVPGSHRRTRRRGALPRIEDLVTAKTSGTGYVLEPTAWTKILLNRLAPLWAGVTLTGDRRRYLAVAPKPVQLPQEARRRVADIDLSSEDEAEFPWLIVGAGVAVVGAGAAYWYFRGR